MNTNTIRCEKTTQIRIIFRLKNHPNMNTSSIQPQLFEYQIICCSSLIEKEKKVSTIRMYVQKCEQVQNLNKVVANYLEYFAWLHGLLL